MECDTISSELGGRSEIRATDSESQTNTPWPAHRRNPQSDIRRTRVRVQALTQHHARRSPQLSGLSPSGVFRPWRYPGVETQTMQHV